ncbi:MAG: hypothetical protein GY936_04265 [Ignavibacteriae bacterium]|nr:hypothetical protein [Ignavibacteriota bacterium]
MISDIKESLEIIKNVHGWIKNILNEHRSMQEQHDAQLLGKAVSLLYSFRALDNGIHAVLGKLILLDVGWSREKRLSLLNEIMEFSHREEIITIIRDSLRDLNYLMWKQNDKGEQVTIEEDLEQFKLIFDYGARIVNKLSDSPVTPFPDRDALRDFSEKIKNAKDDESVNNIIATSTQVMDLLQRTYREKEISGKVSTLKHRIMNRHNWSEKDLGW